MRQNPSTPITRTYRWLAPVAFSLSAILLAPFTPELRRAQTPELAAGPRPAIVLASAIVPTHSAAAPGGYRDFRTTAPRTARTQSKIQNPKFKIASASSSTPLQYRFLPGERRVYRLSYTNSAESDFRALFAGQAGAGDQGSGAAGQDAAGGLTHAFRTRVEGEWVATILESSSKEVRIAIHLSRPAVRLWADGQEAQAQAKTVGEELSRDMLVVADRQGRVRSVQFDPALGDLSQNYARTLLSLLQCVLPGQPAASLSRWTAQEEDPNGQYIAQYQREKGRPGDSGAAQTVRKRKLRYLQPRRRLQATNEEVRPTVLPAGAFVARIDPQNVGLLSLNGSETQKMVIRGTKVGHSATNLRLQCVSQAKVEAAELAALRQAITVRAASTVAQRLSAAQSGEENEAAIQRQELGDATLESLLTGLAKLEVEAAAHPDQPPLATPLYLKLKALVYLHPESCQRLGKLLADSDPSSATATLLTGVMGAVGHAQAQAALVDAIRARSRDAAALTQLIPALTSVQQPTLPAEATMRWAMASAPTRDLRVMAELALGTMARNLAESESARAARIVDEIIRKLRATSGKEETRLRLMALGNAGSARALPMLDRFAADPSPMLRASAIAALRWIDIPQVDARLTRALQSDPDTTVRGEAAGALGFREPTKATIAAQQRAFRTERVESVRLAILSNLGSVQGEFPEIRKLIQTTAAQDASPNVRKAAASLATTPR
jgi:HEAT repeat protein